MARRKSPTLTEVELEFMHLIWERGETNTEELRADLLEKGRPLSDGSVRKILMILVNKGHLTRRRAGHGHIYTPKLSKSGAAAAMIRDMIDRVFQGSAPGLVAALFESRSLKKRDLDQIKKLIEDKEKESRK